MRHATDPDHVHRLPVSLWCGYHSGMMLITMSVASEFTMGGKGSSEVFPLTSISFGFAKFSLPTELPLPSIPVDDSRNRSYELRTDTDKD